MKKIIAAALTVFCATGLMAFAQQAEVETEHAKPDAHAHQHAHPESAWLDVMNCDICKAMSAQAGLMESMKWETHVIPTGMMHFTVVPEEMRPKMNAAEDAMKQTIAEIMQGQQKKCCGYCTGMGQLMAAGAKQTQVRTAGGDVSLVTSEDPAVIERIHAHAKKTKEEFDKMMAGHTGHDH